MDEEVADRRAADVLGLTDVSTDATLTEKADARTENVEQRVDAAWAAGRLGYFARCVAWTEEGDDADRAVAETATQAVLERLHRVCTQPYMQYYNYLSF